MRRPSPGLDFQVRKVCASCNNGWMSNLEAEIIDVLDPLITMQPSAALNIREIPLKQQRKISFWATKTAMMADQTQGVPLLSTQKLKRMRTHSAIPGGTRVWMGACDELYPLVTSHTVKIDVEHVSDTSRASTGLFCSMKIGHLCLYVYFPGMEVVIQHHPLDHLTVARIWPRRTSGLPFPPPHRPRDGEEFESFSDSFWQGLYLYPPEQAKEHGLRES